jgi:hypothetical protein
MLSIDPKAVLKIVALEPSQFQVIEAQFNPKEVQVDAGNAWSKHQDKHGVAYLEFTGRDPRTVAIELMFDGAESGESVGYRLRDMEAMLEHVGDGKNEKRPPRLRLLWGAATDETGLDMPDFDVVLMSMSVKRTMYSRDGKCLRAVVTCKFQEAGDLKLMKSKLR